MKKISILFVGTVFFLFNLNVFSMDCWYEANYPLHATTQQGDLDKVKYFIEEKEIDINCVDPINATPLDKAIRSGHEYIIKYLVEQGATYNNNIRNTLQDRVQRLEQKVIETKKYLKNLSLRLRKHKKILNLLDSE